MNGTLIDTNAEQSDAGADNDGAGNKKVMNEDKKEKGGKLLYKVHCPECHKAIVDLPRHLRSVHRWKADKARVAKQNFQLRKPRKKISKRRPYRKRICPRCSRILVRLENHLHDFHHIKDKEEYRDLLRRAQYVLEAEEEEVNDKTDQDVRPSKNKTRKQLVLKGKHQEGTEDEDEDDDYDPDWVDTLGLECTKDIGSSQSKKSIHQGFQMIRQDQLSRRKEGVTDNAATTESDSYDAGADDIIIPKDSNMVEYIEGTDEEEDTDSDDEWCPESFSTDDEEEDSSDDEGGEGGACGSPEISPIDKFVSWFLSPDGGSKQRKQVDQHASQITKIIKAVGGLENLFDKTLLWEKWLQPFEQGELTKRQPTAGTIKCYLVSLKHLFSYMLNESIYLSTGKTSRSNLQQLKTAMGGWMKVYGRKCEIRFWKKQQEDLLKLIKPHEVRAFDQSKPIIKAEKMFGRLQTCTFQLSMSEYVLVRDYLLSYLCLNNAQRTGAIEWMLLTDVGKGYEKNGSMAVNVLWHKTVRTAGPAILSMTHKVYNNLGIFLEKVRPQIASPPGHKQYAFVSWDEGKRLSSSRVTEQFNSMWKKAVGVTENRPRMNGGLVRKSFTTLVHENHPELRKDLAVTLNHSEATARRSYWIAEKTDIATRTQTKMRQLIRGEKVSPANNGSTLPDTTATNTITEEEVLKLFESDTKITVEGVKRKLIEQNILGSFSPRKICSKLKYNRNKQSAADSPQLPTEEETRSDRLKRIGVAEPLEEQSTVTEPFTDAGSSVKRARYTYTSEELETIKREFKDLIESDQTVSEEDVWHRFTTVPCLKLLDLTSKLDAKHLADKVRTEKRVHRRKSNKNKRK